ncbi:MAG: hypothetical protein LC130_08490 [Bryobacterales bacterium]|nr:hypothetical protein [Bryobacterales bacterium]
MTHRSITFRRTREVTMTVSEALAQIEKLKAQDSPALASQEEIVCPETQKAVRIVAAAFDCVRKRDPLYGRRRQVGCLPPPPARVLPG